MFVSLSSSWESKIFFLLVVRSQLTREGAIIYDLYTEGERPGAMPKRVKKHEGWAAGLSPRRTLRREFSPEPRNYPL